MRRSALPSTTSRDRGSKRSCSLRRRQQATSFKNDVMARAIPLGYGTGDDIAGAVAFLCSEEARFITGQVLGVNGGSVI